ncbi:diacylglycerol/lipid kinase family protein [Cloacibacterium sp.]|uniref:diacylglycerol/lipid kinase family protein n=1 Tax=Cloacibacterium sp. TaxID=1913682 RepID=UPI0039E3CEE1
MQEIAFFINPKIRNFRKIEIELQHHFIDFDYKFFISEYHGHLLSLPQKAISEGYNCMIAVGGDGTLNEVVNGAINAFNNFGIIDWEKISDIKIGVFPAGSGNDFVRNIYDSKITTLKNLIQNNKSEPIDVGFAKFSDEKGIITERFFMNIADVGIGGEVVINKEKLPDFFSARFNYLASILYVMVTYRKKLVKVKTDTFSYKGKILNFVIANGKYFGNAIGIAPHAEINDGKFSITNIGNVSLLDYFLNIRAAKKCEKISHPQVTYSDANEVYIESVDHRKITIDMDGEFVGFAPIKLICEKNRINFIK